MGIFGQARLCKIGSLVRFVKYSRFNEGKYGKCCGLSMVCDGPELIPEEEGLSGGVL